MADSRVSPSLILSYVVDWIVIIIIAAIGGGFYKKTPNHRPFSPVDPDISYPYVEHEKVSSAVLFIVSLVAPAIITAIVALILTPGSVARARAGRGQGLRRKLWEWNTAWMGLALGLATTFLITQGIKTLIGRPRPDLLARCDLDPATVTQFALGGYGTQLPQFNLLISSTACRQTDQARLNDGFQSFPSGHSSFSWAGMVYLSLYLCAKFGMRIPVLLPFKYSTTSSRLDHREPLELGVLPNNFESNKGAVPIRRQAAAPPAYLLILPLFPIAVATYIAGTRFSDFRHHAFDIIFGAIMGTFFAFVGFRMYHLPVGRGAGWSWGPRSSSTAWWSGVGKSSYAEILPQAQSNDLETGHLRNGSGAKYSNEQERSNQMHNT